MRPLPVIVAIALAAATSVAAEPVIEVDNAAQVPPAELESIRKDFATWYERTYAYHHAARTPVTLQLTRKVPFGFYKDGTVLLPPSDDRQAMLEDWVHELTHHVIGRDSNFFFREGTATHTVDVLFAQDRRVPRNWPYFGKTCDEWVALFARRGQLRPLSEMLAWPQYQGATPEQDFRSWQIYLAGGSFVGWYIQTRGYEAYRKAFHTKGGDAPDTLEQAWLSAIAARKLPDFDPAALMPDSKRYRGYADRLKP